jgi:hypothetical protein
MLPWIGLGYPGLLALLYFPPGSQAFIHMLIRPVFIGYTLLTIVRCMMISW